MTLYTEREITDDGDVVVEPFTGRLRDRDAVPVLVLALKPSSGQRVLDRDEAERLRDACDEALR